MIRLVIVSDIRFYREGLEKLIESQDSVCVVATASNVKKAIVEIHNYSPDVILLDMTMIERSEVVGHITSSCPDSKIVAIAVTEDEDEILTCAKAGIAGYVSREASIKQLVTTICGVVKGELYCPRRIAASLFHKVKSQQNEPEAHSHSIESQTNDKKTAAILTQRERQIANQLIKGLSNKQIARNLSIELSTVKNHVHNILVKIGVQSRMQAANYLLDD